jgi:L-alanine-DL-glutamate epimerase-like enolase superfamily enzyme
MSRIAKIEAIPVRIPREAGVAAAEGRLPSSHYYRSPHRGLIYSPHREALFVKITTDDGQVGWGETLASVAPEIAAQVIRTLIEPQWIGQDPLAGEFLVTQLHRSMRDRGHFTGFFIDALAGCDNALWDLRGRLLGQPVFRLLGGPFAERVRTYQSGVEGSTPEERAASARRAVEQGFGAIKLHLTQGRADTVATVEAVREAVGPAIELMVDAHNIYDVAEAIQVGRELERRDVFFFEAPTDPEDVAGLAEIAATLQVRIATGETERSRFQFRDRLVARAVDMVQPDIGYVGLTEMRRIALLAEAFHVPIAPHVSAGMGMSIAATLHLMASIPNGLILEHRFQTCAAINPFLTQPIVWEEGYLRVPDGPGMGVEPKEEALRAVAIKSD